MMNNKRNISHLKTTSLLLLLTIGVQAGIAQNIEFEKVLDHKIDVPNHANSEAPYFVYKKFQEDKLLRFEDDKVQLFDSEINLLWEVELGNVKTGNGDNYYYHFIHENQVYIAQRGFSTIVKNTNCKVHKITADGQLSSLDLTGKFLFTEIVDLGVINDKFILFTRNDDHNNSTYKPYFDVSVMDAELTKFLLTHQLPRSTEGLDHNPRWEFIGVREGNLVYADYYSKKINPTDEYAVGFRREYVIDLDLKLVSDESVEIEDEEFIEAIALSSPVDVLYDTSKYEVYVWGNYINGNWPISLWDNVGEVTINYKTGKDISVKDGFFRLKTGKSKVSGFRVMVYEVIEDPINNSINFIFHFESHPAFLITLNESLEVVHYHQFKVGYTQYSDRPPLENLVFPFAGAKKEGVGKLPQGHKMNALDFAMTLKEKTFYTIINYSDYQLLFSDNKSKGTTTVYKVVR